MGVKKKAKKKTKEKKRAKSRSEEKSSPRELPTENLLDLTRKAVHETNKSYQDLPSASDYSDLDSPRGSPGPQLASVISRTDKAGSLQSDFLEQGGSSAKRRLGRKCDREVGRRRIEETRNNEEVVVVTNVEELRRKDTKRTVSHPGQTYFAKILGDLRRQGGSGRSEVVQKKRDNMRIEVTNNSVKDRLGARKEEVEEKKEVKREVKVKKTLERKRRKVVESDSEEELKNRKSKRSEKAKSKVDASALRSRDVKRQVSKSKEDYARSKEDDSMSKEDDASALRSRDVKSQVSKSKEDYARSKEDDSMSKEDDARSNENADYAPFGKRKLRLRSKQARSSLSSLNTPVKTPRMSDLKSPGSRVSESFALDDSLDLPASASQTGDNEGEDVMKQLDDFIND